MVGEHSGDGVSIIIISQYECLKTEMIDGNAWTSGNVDPIYARGVYPAKDTSCMGRARVKQEEEADTRLIVK